MQILASALPGFRELRAPVIAGYLWLIFTWLAVQPDANHRPHDALLGSLYDLAHDAGAIPVGIALSVAAYLTGSVSQAVSRATTRPVSTNLRQWLTDPAPMEDEITPVDADERLQLLQSSPGAEHLTDTIEVAINNIDAHLTGYDRRDVEIRSKLYAELKEQARNAGMAIERELSLPATLLVGDRPELFAEVDRLRSEGELRLTVVPPLAAILILFSTQTSPLSLFAAIPVLILVIQGLRRQQDARRLTADAMRIGSVPSSAATSFNEWVTSIPARIQDLETRISQRERESDLATTWLNREIRESGEKTLDVAIKNVPNGRSGRP